MTPPKSTPEGVAEILAAYGQHLTGYVVNGVDSELDIEQAAQALHDLYTQRFREAIGEMETPYTSHANKQMLVQANEQVRYNNHFRAEAIKRWEELSKGDV